jgi:hypothetical protein
MRIILYLQVRLDGGVRVQLISEEPRRFFKHHGSWLLWNDDDCREMLADLNGIGSGKVLSSIDAVQIREYREGTWQPLRCEK